MEKSAGIREEDVLDQESDLRLEDGEVLEEEKEEVEKVETVPAGGFENPIQGSYRFKITEILKNLHSSELVIYSKASKDFISLLSGDYGGSILCEYVQLSPKCAELLEAWKLHLGKPGMSFILSLVSVILSHPDGKFQSVSIRSSLDNVARSIIDDKLDDIYAELNSQELRRQSAALSLLGSIVKRRMGLASEVAKRFDFKLPAFSKLSGIQKKKAGKDFKHVVRTVTRQAFVGFAMSFLEVGNPRLLRWILQQREMYSGVLRGLANDDSDTIIIVLSTLRDKVLIESSLVPPGLRSVLFGSATLEQLSYISANQLAGPASDIAHDVLVMVCTDPQNGLMPGSGLKGNKKRLLDLMRKLKATEVGHHKQLLLSIVKGKANLCSSYMDEFPYCLEPRPSSSWFSAISLAADLVSTSDAGASISTIASHLCNQPVADIDELHAILKSIIPRTFTRSVINKGLLHSDSLVKHGSLRLIFESLKSLDSLITSVDRIIVSTVVRQEDGFCRENVVSFHNLPSLECLVHADKDFSDGEIVSPPSDEVGTHNWFALKHYVQNEIRAELPDPQVLLKLLSSSSSKYSGRGVKRPANFPNSGMKKMKSDEVSEKIDIVIGGLDMLPTNIAVEDSTNVIVGFSNQNSEVVEDHFSSVYNIWGLNEKTTFGNKSKDADYFFQSKLLDVLKFYLRALPIAFEGSFDFFKILPFNPSSLSINQQQSLLSLLVDYIRQPSGNQVSAEVPESMYKHLHPLINFLIFSHVKDIQSQAYTLVRAAMISTGAFDQNFSEIDTWFVFLPGYIKNIHIDQNNGVESLCDEAAVVISFLCEAVSTIGNNLYKYLSELRKLLPDHLLCCSPLVVCVLQKCLRLIESDSGTFKLYEKSLISLYVGNTLSLILHSQVDMRTLPCLIYKLLYEFFKDHSSAEEDSMNFKCEWRPLKNLFDFACNIMNKKFCIMQPVSRFASGRRENPFSLVIDKVEELLRQAQGERVDKLASSFSSSILCTAPDDILENLPSVLAILQLYFPSHLPFLSSIFFQEQRLLVRIREFWPNMFFFGLEMINQAVNHSYGGEVGYLSSSNTSILATNCDSPEFSASAFCSFLKHSSFYALFSAILSFATWDSHLTRIEEVFPSTTILELLQVKILEVSVDDSILHLKYVLFWTYHMFLMYKVKQSFIISELLQMCITLVQDIMDHILEVIFNQAGLKAVGLSSVGQYAQVIIELTFSHPIVTLYISNSLYFSREFTDDASGNSINSFLTTFKQNIHPMDHCTLQLLRKFLSVLSSALSSLKTDNSACKSLIRVRNNLIQKILLSFREKFEQFVVSKNPGPFLPIFYMFHSLMEFISPFILLELVHWIFSKIEGNISGGTSFLEYAVSVGLYIADGSLDKLYCFLQASTLKLDSDFSLVRGIKSFDASLVPKIIYKILDFTLSFNLEQGDLCLLKAVNAIYNLRCVKPLTALFPLHVLLSSMIFNIPVKLLVYCIHPTSKIKAKTLMLLTEVSPVHMNLFGTLFLTILDNSLFTVDSSNAGCMWPSKGKMTSNSKDCFLNDDFLLLLPVALSFFSSTLVKHGKHGIQPLKKIPLTYGAILLDGFCNWNTFVSREIFQEDYDDFSPVSLEEFNKFYCRSLIGQAIVMLSYFFVLNRSSIRLKKRLKLFDSICPQLCFFDEQFSIGAEGLDACSYKDSLKLVNQIAAKISFIRLLFSSECSIPSLVISEEESVKDMFTAKESYRLDRAKLKFMNILVITLDQIFKQFPLKVNSSVAGCATHCYQVFRFLELLILKEIVWLSNELRCFLIESSYFTLLNNFIRSSLLHRFEDPVTLKAIRCILVALSGSTFSFSDVLEHLIGHSVFVKIISSNHAISDSSVSASSGTLLQPISSVLKLVDVSFSLQNVQQNVSHYASKMRCDDYSVEDAKLELVRLLRILFLQIDRNAIMGCFNSKELLSMLLCGYSATQSQIDLEIFHLIHEVELLEGPDNGSLEALDYIWGVAALKMRKEKAHDVLLPVNMTSDCEPIEKQKILFRENIPIDSKVCAVTVLHLCNDRSTRVSASLESILKDTFINYPKIIENFKKDNIQPYDPSFILRFSSHSLSMGYLEPVEFSRLGLLAVTFSSISSSDDNLRKLGYECLGRFKISLESCRKSKDLLQLQLLLTFLQNGITKEWQKIPSIIAIFAAEASLTLLDHSHNYFLSISKFLMRFPRVDLKAVPLFQTLLGSSSMHFRTDSFWILRLLYAGLNSPIDAKLYLSNNILGVVLSYSASSLVDDEFKILTLMIVKKSVQLHMLADQLVKEFGLIPWLSSLLLFYGERLIGHQERSSVDVVKLILEVVKDVISSTIIIEWLHDCGLEQLSEFSLLLVKLFVGAVKLLKEDVSLVNTMLIVITSTVKLSQKRNICQPHFTLSLECLFQLFQTISIEFGSSEHTIELGMNSIFMNTPIPVTSHEHKARLMKLLTWAAPAALWLTSTKKSLIKDLNTDLTILSDEDQGEESPASKLLRWVSASIILGTVICNHSEICSSSSISGNDNMLSYLKGISIDACKVTKDSPIVDESLAVLILHIQGFFCMKSVLPTILSALCVLLLGIASSRTGTVKKYLDDNYEKIQSLCSKIPFPAEANPAWRWSINQPCNDSSKSETELMAEECACRSLLVIFSNAVGVGKSHGFPAPSIEDAENYGLFQWEGDAISGSRSLNQHSI